jgi:hypothetical protein
MSDLVAKVTLTADATQLVGESQKATAALDNISKSAGTTGIAGKTMGDFIGGAASEIDGAADSAEKATAKIPNLGRVFDDLGTRVGIGAYQFRALRSAIEALPAIAEDFPIATAIAGVTAGVILGVQAYDSYSATMTRVQGTAIALGNQFGLDKQQIDALTSSVAEAGDASIKQAAAMEQAFLNANLSPDTWNAAAAASLKLASYWQTDVPSAAAKLADALKDPKGAGEELLATLNALDPDLKTLIENFQNSGDKADAADAIIARVNLHLKDMPNTVGLISGAFDHFTSALGNADVTLGKWETKLLNFTPPDWLLKFISTTYNASAGQIFGGIDLDTGSHPETISVTGQRGGIDGNDIQTRQAAAMADPDDINTLAQNVTRAKESINNLVILIDDEKRHSQDTSVAVQELATAHQNLAKAQKAQADALLNLDDIAKMHAEQVKEAIKDGEKLIASSQLEAQQQQNITDATLAGGLALQRANDNLAIQKAVLPLVTAQKYADAAAYEKLQHDIDAVTASMEKQQAAQHASAAITDVRSQTASLSPDVLGSSSLDAMNAAYGQNITASNNWLEQTVANLTAEGKLTEEMADKIALIFQQKMSAPFNQAVNDIRTGISGLSQYAGNDGLDLMFQESERAAEDWKTKITGEIDGAKAALANFANTGTVSSQYDDLFSKMFGADYQSHLNDALTALNHYADAVHTIFADKLAKDYVDDLNRRTDWNSGLQRGMISQTNDINDWAKTSAQALKDFDDEGEKLFTSLNETGKQRMQDLENFIIQMLLKLAYQKFMAGYVNTLGNSIFSEIGSLFGPTAGPPDPTFGAFHTGGVIGDGAPMTRDVSPFVFAGARRFHTGGLVAGEVPIIAKKGERVLTVEQNRAWEMGSQPMVINLPAGAASMPQVNFNVTNKNPDAKVSEGQHSMGSDGSFNFEAIVDKIEDSVSGRIQRGRSGIGKSFETFYGLRRGVQP